MKPVSIFIDEAQKVLNKSYLPEVDVCRESRFEFIFATQDDILLINKLGELKFNELFSNIEEQYSFKTNRNDELEQHEVLNLLNKRKLHTKPLFFSKEELIKTEYRYLEGYNLLKYSDFFSLEPYMFKFDEILFEDYKLIVETIDGRIIEVNYTEPIDSPENENEMNVEHVNKERELLLEKLKELREDTSAKKTQSTKKIDSSLQIGNLIKVMSNIVHEHKLLKEEFQNMKKRLSKLEKQPQYLEDLEDIF